jgi:spermidine synthase
MFNKLFSYIIPLNIYKQKSLISKTLEVTWTNGQLVLDSNNTNYSCGSLQQILRKGLKFIGFEKIRDMKKILVLGVAGGSVIKTLVNEINYTEKIIGVEIDKDVIEIAKEYFKLDKIQNLEIVIEDANQFVLNCTDKFDLLIIDIFQDAIMPEFLFEKLFIDGICKLLNSNGFILFNTMIIDRKQKQINLDYLESFDTNFYSVIKLNEINKTNELILINKLI